MTAPRSFHQHYRFIQQLVPALQRKLKGATLNDAFTLSKQELVLLFSLNGQTITVKVIAKFHSGFLLIEDVPYSKGSNAQACFEHALGQQVEKVEAHAYNRSFSIWFANRAQLIFKCYDALINVAEVKEEAVSDLFRESIRNDWTYDASEFTITDEAIIHKLDSVEGEEGVFYIYKAGNGYYLSLKETTDELVLKTSDAIEASSVFARFQLGALSFQQAKISRMASHEGELKRYRQQAKLCKQSIHRLLSESPYEETGHLIMANLHAIKAGSNEAELFDFYTGKQVTIRLKPDLSPAENAAYYYRKAKNKKIELEQLEQKLLSMQQKIVKQEEALEQLKKAENSRQLKGLQPVKKQQEVFPFKKFEVNGFEIWVGKNAANNDLLTQKYAHKNDLWLHAKDVSGSHTIIRHKAGKPFTKDIIEIAARIAAYYSRHKSNALAPVSYTLKKYVRKPKGSEPGQVVVDREEVIIVEPKLL